MVYSVYIRVYARAKNPDTLWRRLSFGLSLAVESARERVASYILSSLATD